MFYKNHGELAKTLVLESSDFVNALFSCRIQLIPTH